MSAIASAIIDTREPKWVQELTFGGVPTAVTALDAGDVMIATADGAVLLIERKTPSDLLNTLRGGRFFPQCVRMREQTPWCYLVITGLLYRNRDGNIAIGGRGHTGWNFDAVQGALLTAQEMGIGVIHCGNDQDFENAVMRLANRSRGDIRIAPPRNGYLLQSGEAALAALPSIGMERVKALCERFPHLAEALVWLTKLKHETQVPGIADGTKQAVRQALKLAPNEQLFVTRGDVVSVTLGENGSQGLILADKAGWQAITKLIQSTMERKKQDGNKGRVPNQSTDDVDGTDDN